MAAYGCVRHADDPVGRRLPAYPAASHRRAAVFPRRDDRGVAVDPRASSRLRHHGLLADTYVIVGVLIVVRIVRGPASSP
ncbi:hypothetical protein AB5I41_27265 [Sphingomonas sp. MMS24-JH45]